MQFQSGKYKGILAVDIPVKISPNTCFKTVLSPNIAGLQMYDNYYCKCRCQTYDERRQCLQQRRTKYWNEDNCQCLCLTSQWKECSTGYVYDPVETCE